MPLSDVVRLSNARSQAHNLNVLASHLHFMLMTAMLMTAMLMTAMLMTAMLMTAMLMTAIVHYVIPKPGSPIREQVIPSATTQTVSIR